MKFKALSSIALLALATLVLGACGTGGSQAAAGKTITIGSKNFTEQVILGELYSQALEAKGYKVNRKLNLGSVQVLDQALQSKQIDMYPEYTGTALETVMNYKGPKPQTPEETYNIAKDFYAKRNPSDTLLKSANFNNTYGIVVRKEIAQKYNLKTLEDLAKASPNLIFASFSEFQSRPDGYPNIKKNYPETNFKEVLITNSIGLKYQALQAGKADAAPGFTTDGQIASQNLVVMQDTKNIWPYYYPTPIIDTGYLKSHPEVEGIINSVSEKLDEKTMQNMNADVEIKQEEPASVARKFLSEKGLL